MKKQELTGPDLVPLSYQEMISIDGGEIILNDQAAVADGAARVLSGVYEFFTRAAESFGRRFRIGAGI